MGVRLNTDCLLCHFNKNLQTARELGTDAQAMEFARDLMEIYLKYPAAESALEYGPDVTALLCRRYGLKEDRFLEEKQASNAYVLDRMDALCRRGRAAADPVYAGLQFSILGNYIDFSALYGEVSFEKLDAMLDRALEMDLDRDAYASLLADLERGKKLLYLTDNAGEIGFDRIFAQEIQHRFPHLEIIFCVRGGPTLNDATREDAAAVGIPFRVIDNGNTIAGTMLKALGPEARDAMETADVIIAKGQANAETLLGSGYNIYFAFLVKCIRFQQLFQKPKLTPMLVREWDSSAEENRISTL